jgi:hypothetical protein
MEQAGIAADWSLLLLSGGSASVLEYPPRRASYIPAALSTRAKRTRQHDDDVPAFFT